MKKVFLSAFLMCLYLTNPLYAQFDMDEISEAFKRACPPPPIESPKPLESSGKKVSISIDLNGKRSHSFDGKSAAHYLENADFLDPDEAESKMGDLSGYYICVSFKNKSPGKFQDGEIGFLNIAVMVNERTGIRLSYLDEVQFTCASEEFSGIGLGTTALKLFADLSDQLGCKWSALRVVSDSPYAGRLYQKFGFRVTERSIRRLGRFNITPHAFVEDTSGSRAFLPPICMERQKGQLTLEPGSPVTIDADLLCVPRMVGSPFPDTPERKKLDKQASAIAESEGEEDKENKSLLQKTEELDFPFAGFGSGSSSPKVSPPGSPARKKTPPASPARKKTPPASPLREVGGLKGDGGVRKSLFQDHLNDIA